MILDEIVSHKKKEVESLKADRPESALEKEVGALPPKDHAFLAALKAPAGVGVIAEIKRKSPSRGVLRDDFEPETLARQFEAAGASALSVLTDQKYFGGSGEILKKVRAVTRLPILRKDFVIDRYQILEARLWGADAVLLIAAILSKEDLKNLYDATAKLGLDALVEIHSEADARKIVGLRAKIIGINNRDLKTFKVDTGTTRRLLRRCPKTGIVVSESGIQTRADLLYLKGLGVRAALVGESLMTARDPAAALRSLLGNTRGAR